MMRHATVHDYAEWLFQDFDMSMGDHAGGVPVPLVDFVQLRTIEEANAACSHVYNAVKFSEGEAKQSPDRPAQVVGGVCRPGVT